MKVCAAMLFAECVITLLFLSLFCSIYNEDHKVTECIISGEKFRSSILHLFLIKTFHMCS